MNSSQTVQLSCGNAQWLFLIQTLITVGHDWGGTGAVITAFDTSGTTFDSVRLVGFDIGTGAGNSYSWTATFDAEL